MISDWEKSGNGFGQRSTDDDEWGRFKSDAVNGDNRASFLRNHKEHILYFWDLSDKEDIMGPVLNVLSKDVSVDCDGNIAVDTSKTQFKRKPKDAIGGDDADRKRFRDMVGQGFGSWAATSKDMTAHSKTMAEAETKRAAAETKKAAIAAMGEARQWVSMATDYKLKALSTQDASARAMYQEEAKKAQDMANYIMNDM